MLHLRPLGVRICLYSRTSIGVPIALFVLRPLGVSIIWLGLPFVLCYTLTTMGEYLYRLWLYSRTSIGGTHCTHFREGSDLERFLTESPLLVYTVVVLLQKYTPSVCRGTGYRTYNN